MNTLTKQLLKLASKYEEHLEETAETVKMVGHWSSNRKRFSHSMKIKKNVTFKGFINWLQTKPKPLPTSTKK